MPSKKKKYNARFPPARIKKIMQTDEEIGKVAAAVPVIISRALELFLESLLTKACHVTQSRNAKTMTTSHLGRKPGSGRKNGGAGSKGKDKKLSGTESEQEQEDSEDSETDGDEDDGSQSSTNQQAASMFHSSNAPSQVVHMGNMVSAATLPPAQALGTIAFAPHPSMVSIAPPPPAPAPHKNEEEDDDDEDYDS
ncbi:dr1-associated corepressor isoform X3 [Fundulus heteroclitus]|uniref:dr1-associated corepressor isoform X3 n=1 Tax=Fundulus heteroclitus TaxID=8078 RepID=UPI00165CAE8D|nr:dr1-associated corepressor isoform X3 [Fundulus heteroclitus]